MPPHKELANRNPSTNINHQDPTVPTIEDCFPQMIQLMLNQPCQAHENQANLQEQMTKKDEDHAQEIKQFQRQLLEVL